MNPSTFPVHFVEPAVPILFIEEKCTGCNRCIEACQMDLLIPNEIKGQPPVVAYPEECWYCGCCVMDCPHDAIKMQHPLMNQARWVEKSSLAKS
jgi:Na+-translocating ferredoxin:NAD+ oxidoreductase RNF subunit RnfB